MPELPEVETTLRGIEPYVREATLTNVVVRDHRLRWPVPEGELKALINSRLIDIERRAKYILIHTHSAAILLHLGMSGSLRVLPETVAPTKHDHIDLVLKPKTGISRIIRLNDPRRFGCCMVIRKPVFTHKLLASLGPEPLSEDFDGALLHRISRGKTRAVKNLIMDGKVVVGVGNIYASEALHMAGIRPSQAAGKIGKARYESLASCIKLVLSRAIQAGGTTLNDFTDTDGKPGYFAQKLLVYGRAGMPCFECDTPIKSQVIGQRNTFYCIKCQKY